MPKIVIKRINATIDVAKTDILKILSERNIRISSIKNNNGLFHVYCDFDSDMDSFFSPECVSALERVNCLPVSPPQLLAKRTVLLHKLDPIITERNVNELRTEIERCNENVIVDEIFKFSNSTSIKLSLSTQKMASTVAERGLRLFHLVVPPRNIAMDRYISVDICFRCYQLDDHVSSNCPKDNNYVICSICSSTSHKFTECSASFKKCVNCKGAHSTLALSCPIRKKIIEKKRKETSTYAGRVRGNADIEPIFRSSKMASSNANGTSVCTKLLPSQDVINRSTMCVLIASIKEGEKKGSFQATLNELLRANGLSSFEMGSVEPPIFSEVIKHVDDVNDIRNAAAESSGSSVVLDNISDHNEPNSEKETKKDDIILYKKRGPMKITPLNVATLVDEGRILIESQMENEDCLELLKLDVGIAKVVQLTANEFVTKSKSTKSGNGEASCPVGISLRRLASDSVN